MPADTAPKKILIVEDEKPLARALSLKLQSTGFMVTTAFNGVEAIDVLGKDHFDLMILDLIMPRMDGFAVLKKLKEKQIKLPIIVSSNLAQAEDIERAKALGAEHYFIKSNVSLNEIIDNIKKILE